MARLFSESLEAGHLLRFTGSSGGGSTIVTSPALDGSRSLQVVAGTSFVDLTAVSEFYAGFYFQTTNTAAQQNIFSWETTAGTLLGFLRLNTATQLLEVYDGLSALLATGTSTLSDNTKYHIQIHVIIDNASGVADVKLDNNNEITFAGDTRSGADTTANRFRLISSSTGYFDAIIINDTTGSADNTWPGIVRFKQMLPAGVGTYVNNWTRNTGSTNWEQVDEVPHDSDTTYLYTTTASLYESFSMADHGLTNASIKAVLTSAITKKDSGVSKLIIGIRDNDNSTNYMTPAQNLAVSYGVIEERRTVDPSSGAAWTAAGANATEALIVSSD